MGDKLQKEVETPMRSEFRHRLYTTVGSLRVNGFFSCLCHHFCFDFFVLR